MYNNEANKKDQLKPSEAELLDEMYRMAKRKRSYTKADIIELLDVRQSKIQRVSKKARRLNHPQAVVFTDYTPTGDKTKTGQFYLVAMDDMSALQAELVYRHDTKIVDGVLATNEANANHTVFNDKITGLRHYQAAAKQRQSDMEILYAPKSGEFQRQQAEVSIRKQDRIMARVAKQNPAVRELIRVVV